MTEDSRNMEGTENGTGQQNPRHINPTLPGVLQFVSGIDPVASTRTPAPLDPERREFLTNALQSMTIDHVKRLQQLMDLLTKSDEHVTDEEKEDALEELIDWCDDIDFGSDFIKIGGVDSLLAYLNSQNGGLRWRLLDVMATVVQNNEWAQNEARKKDWMKLFVELLEKDNVILVRIKALYAISCMVRGNETNLKEFLDKHDGFGVLVRASQSDVEKLQIKSIFLMTSIVQTDPSNAQEIWRIGLVEQLVGLAHLHVKDTTALNFLTEHIFSALVFFASSNTNCLTECRRPDLPLRSIIKQRLALIGDDETHEEERGHAKELLRLIGGEVDQNQDNCDTER